jgi:hypothetical protein
VDIHIAVQLYGQAAGQGHAKARWFLGLRYEHGRGVPHDMGAAVALYRQAIEGGCVSVNASLGLCFEKGRGVVHSTAEAERLYKLAAKSGSSTWDDLPGGLVKLLEESLSPNDTFGSPSAARARIQFVVYSFNVMARQGDAVAGEQLKFLAGRRDVVSACCVGCGAVRQLKTCAKCRIAVRQVPHRALLRQGVHSAHVARAQGSCKAWRAESAADAEQS